MRRKRWTGGRRRRRRRIDWCSGSEARGAQEISRNFRFSN